MRPRSRTTIAEVFSIAATVLALTAPAPWAIAKEPVAGCGPAAALVERLRNALVLATVHRARGSSLAAFEVMLVNARTFARDSAAAGCGMLAPWMTRALGRADAAPDALGASLELEQGYGAVISAAVTGRLPGDKSAVKLLPVAESAEYGEGCPDIFQISRRLAGAPETLLERITAVLKDLRERPRCAKLRQFLENAPRSRLVLVVESIRLDEPDTLASTKNPIAGCPELPMVMERLALAIAVGAPLFNRGDHEACRRHYDSVIQNLTDEVIPAARCPGVRTELANARADATRASTPGEAAWALRRGFDRIANSVGGRADDQDDGK